MLLQVTVGRSEILKNGIRRVNWKFEPVKINIHRQASYDHILTKCSAAAWGDVGESASYVLTDTGRMKIQEKLVIDQPDGTDEVLPWTLETYLQEDLSLSTKISSAEEIYTISNHVVLGECNWPFIACFLTSIVSYWVNNSLSLWLSVCIVQFGPIKAMYQVCLFTSLQLFLCIIVVIYTAPPF